MFVWKCNRCKKEFEKLNIIHNADFENCGAHLCYDCYPKFEEWLEKDTYESYLIETIKTTICEEMNKKPKRRGLI